LSKSNSSVMIAVMSTATAQLLEQFEKLPIDEQREFSSAILQRVAHFEYDSPSDDELTTSAAAIFAMLDLEEEDDAAAR